MQDCNTHECVGDEVCIAEQDLIMNVDGSGSVNEENWKLIVNFTGELLKRYQDKYYGDAAMQIGIGLFGNGAIETDGTISKAILVHELSADLATVRTEAAAMAHQKVSPTWRKDSFWQKNFFNKGGANKHKVL